jgi:hypothetical protein
MDEKSQFGQSVQTAVDNTINWQAKLSDRVRAALTRRKCKWKSDVRRIGREAFMRDPTLSASDLEELDAALAGWAEPPPVSSPTAPLSEELAAAPERGRKLPWLRKYRKQDGMLRKQ